MSNGVGFSEQSAQLPLQWTVSMPEKTHQIMDCFSFRMEISISKESSNLSNESLLDQVQHVTNKM